MDISVIAPSSVERGERNPALKTLEKVADFLDIPRDLLTDPWALAAGTRPPAIGSLDG